MKLFVYSYRDFDEGPFFEEYRKEYGVELGICREVPTLENAHLAGGCQYVSILTNPVDRALLQRYRDMGIKMISTRTVGYDHIDLASAKEFGVGVSNATYPSESVAEYTVMCILMALRRMKRILERAAINDFSLKGNMGGVLSGKTVGIVGAGRIGCQVARLLQGFGCRVLAYDLHPRADMEGLLTYVGFEELLCESQVVTLHMPIGEQNTHMIDAAALRKMPKGVVVVNTARGGLIDTKALIAALESGQVGAAAMDVIEGEFDMYYFDRKADVIDKHDLFILRGFPNVFVTPHMAFYTDLSIRYMVKSSIESCVRDARGEENPWKVL